MPLPTWAWRRSVVDLRYPYTWHEPVCSDLRRGERQAKGTEKSSMKIVVDAKSWNPVPDLREVFAHRDLFLTLAYRDVRVRYAQTMLGLGWALFQPLATLLIMVLVFGRAVKVDTQGVPYSLFAITGISAWSYFAFVLKESGSSLIGAQEMVRKIYFPRLIIPLSKATVGLIDMGVAVVLMLIMFAVHGRMPAAQRLQLRIPQCYAAPL